MRIALTFFAYRQDYCSENSPARLPHGKTNETAQVACCYKVRKKLDTLRDLI